MNGVTKARGLDCRGKRTGVTLYGFKALWLEVFPYKSKRSLLTAGVYRPPSNNAEQDKMLGINIENAYLLNKEMILLGDFNVNFLSYIDFKKHYLVKILHSLNLTQVVNSITRPLSKTCLDHMVMVMVFIYRIFYMYIYNQMRFTFNHPTHES